MGNEDWDFNGEPIPSSEVIYRRRKRPRGKYDAIGSKLAHMDLGQSLVVNPPKTVPPVIARARLKSALRRYPTKTGTSAEVRVNGSQLVISIIERRPLE